MRERDAWVMSFLWRPFDVSFLDLDILSRIVTFLFPVRNEHYRESIMLFDFNDDPTIVFCKFKPRCYFSALRSKSLYYERSKCLPVQISSRDFVRVKRTSGALETDWKILALQEIILENKPVLAARVRNSSMVTKCVPLEEFFTLNPNWHYHGQWVCLDPSKTLANFLCIARPYTFVFSRNVYDIVSGRV